MSVFSRLLAVAGLIVAGGLIGYYYGNVAAPVQDDPSAAAQVAPDRDATREIIRDYLLERPEVLEEAMTALRARRQEERQARTRAAIADNRAALLSHDLSPVSGNPEGDVTLVEFFDYACGYCKRSLSVMMNLLESDPQLRVVWKELPVLGPVSRIAARASMAAARQGRYLAFHEAIMGARDGLSEASVLAAAERVGLDVDRLQQDMSDPAIEAYLEETNQLARNLGIEGTPAFVIGDTLVPGAVGEARLKQLIAEARSGG